MLQCLMRFIRVSVSVSLIRYRHTKQTQHTFFRDCNSSCLFGSGFDLKIKEKHTRAIILVPNRDLGAQVNVRHLFEIDWM